MPASNGLLLRGAPSAVGEMISLIRRIDAVSASNQTFRVVYLDHAQGEDLLPILEQFSEAMSSAETGGRPVSIAHHAPTNSIILNADPDVLRELEQVISRLDVRRPQVQVEAIVVEISDQAARDLGVQFLLAGDGSDPVMMLAIGAVGLTVAYGVARLMTIGLQQLRDVVGAEGVALQYR